jgi:hypothetical protein
MARAMSHFILASRGAAPFPRQQLLRVLLQNQAFAGCTCTVMTAAVPAASTMVRATIGKSRFIVCPIIIEISNAREVQALIGDARWGEVLRVSLPPPLWEVCSSRQARHRSCGEAYCTRPCWELFART